MLTNFSLDSFRITDTRSRHEDTDYVTVSITVGTNPTVTKTQRVGDVNNGTHHVGLGVAAEIPTNKTVPVVFSYVILNNGHGSPSTVEKEAEKALSALGSKAADAASKVVASAIGAAVGEALGTAVVPLVGSAIGALAGWLVGSIGGILFANCDGVVAAGMHVYSSADLIHQTAAGHRISETADHHGTKSPDGCGGNSRYYTTTTISTVASIQTIIDLNGKWAYGGVPGPVVSVTGDGIIIDMAAYHRPPAHGSIVDPSTISVNFPDDKQYIGKLVLPGTLQWPNNSSWTKVAHAAVAKPLATTAT